jgi:hypothetical protein
MRKHIYTLTVGESRLMELRVVERGGQKNARVLHSGRGARGKGRRGDVLISIGCRRAQIREPMPVPAACVPLLGNCSGVYSAGPGRGALF